MGRKATGGTPGRKPDFAPEQMEFLTSFAERYQKKDIDAGEFYTEVTNLFIPKFGFTVLNPNTKVAVSIDALRLDTDVETMEVEEQIKIKKLRAAAKEALRTVGDFVCFVVPRHVADQLGRN